MSTDKCIVRHQAVTGASDLGPIDASGQYPGPGTSGSDLVGALTWYVLITSRETRVLTERVDLKLLGILQCRPSMRLLPGRKGSSVRMRTVYSPARAHRDLSLDGARGQRAPALLQDMYRQIRAC